MRMWMVDPRIMCRKHLLGEHVEHHMFIGTIKRGVSLQGYADKNLFELQSLYKRHDALVKEMQYRGYNHKSEMLGLTQEQLSGLPDVKVDAQASLKDLITRCPDCKNRHDIVTGKISFPAIPI